MIKFTRLSYFLSLQLNIYELDTTIHKQKFTITLSVSDVKKLKSIISKGVCQARTVKRAQILLNRDKNAIHCKKCAIEIEK